MYVCINNKQTQIKESVANIFYFEDPTTTTS